MAKEEMRLQLLQLAVQHAGPKNAVRVAAEYEAYVYAGSIPEVSQADGLPNVSATEGFAINARHPDLPQPKAAEVKNAEQPAAPAGKTATSDECNKAFAAHAQKGGGRSAKTARDAIVKVIPHFSSFKALTPEECAKAIEAMEAA